MNIAPEKVKPRTVFLAEWALWAWTTWVCLFGLYQSWADLPDMLKQISDSASGMITIDAHGAQKWAVLYYLAQAAATVWFILKIGQGKHWARSSFMWCYVLEILWLIASSLLSPSLSFSDIPDLGLQAIAMYWLYTKPGSDWFEVPESKRDTELS